MVNTTSRSRYFLDIAPELRNRVKAVAALQGKTIKDWLTAAIVEKLEDDIDAREGLATLGDKDGTVSLKQYLNTQKDLKRV
jgi:hypothetical protein